jgi:hypothetical protein
MFIKKHLEDTKSAISNNLITIQIIVNLSRKPQLIPNKKVICKGERGGIYNCTVNLSLKPQLIPNKIVICKGERGGIYNGITDKGPKKGRGEMAVKVH